MKAHTFPASRSIVRAVGLLVLASVLSNARHASAQEPCPLPPGAAPPADPPVLAQQVEDGSASLRDFALSSRDVFKTWTSGTESVESALYFGCLVRQEGGPYRSGSTYHVSLTPDGRVFVHMKDMSLSGGLLNPLIYAEILSALGVSPTVLANLASPDPNTATLAGVSLISALSQEPDAPFDATTPIPGLRPGIPGASGYASTYRSGTFGLPLVLLTGFELNSSHLAREPIDYGDPTTTAEDVVDRETLKDFVTQAGNYVIELQKSGDIAASSRARIAMRDPNGPWRHGSVYLYILDRTSNVIFFHGAFPDRFELRPLLPTVRDVVTGELVLPQVLAAASSSPEGGFLEYYWDDPTDDTDSADIPKVGYARQFTGSFQRSDGTVVSLDFVVGSGFYGSSPAGGPAMTSACSDHNIAASAVRTQSDIRAFVTCAAEYLAEHGTTEARRAFNQDARWKHGPTYVFVDGIAESGTDAKTFVYPPDPSREGGVWGEAINDFGNDLFYEAYRMTQVVDDGWLYYSFPNPATGKRSAKASYVIEIDWDGEPAVIGAGIYSRDWPGTCYPDEVSAEVLHQTPSPETLREFVRCAALAVEADGYFAKREIERDPRWTDGQHYVYVLDMLGNQVMSGRPVRVNGRAPHEWGRGGPRGDQFGGRDMAAMGDTFGESYVYYRAYDPLTGTYQPKVGFLKRVVAQGVPLLVGASYSIGSAAAAVGPSCADNYVTAAAARTQVDIPAFVRCAAEYVREHGEAEARRAFNEDARWKSGPTYVFVDGVQPSGETALTHVFPPDPAREGSVWGTSIDSFGSDYYYELHRILSLVDEGWIYYAFNNPAIGRSQPKSSYVMEIEWNGDRAAIGAGIYARDFPGTCEPTEVNAADLAANPGDQRLQEFVRCAALEVESAGYFAGPVLSGDPRWKHGPIYMAGINAATGMIEFSGSKSTFAASGRIPELLFDGRDAIEGGALFGESFWYYNFNNPVTGEVEPKVGFFKLVRAQGVPLLVGSGYHP